jgi:hypothetical protein
MSEIRRVRLIRAESDDQGTDGLLSTDSGFQIWTLEPPWRNNAQGLSCIFPGTYLVQLCPTEFPKHPNAYALRKVKDRTAILFHKGNFAGDVKKGFKADSEGCILLGRAIGEIGGQKALLSSLDATRAFYAEMEGKDFILDIAWAPGREPKLPA